MLALKCSALAIVGAASSDCLANASTEQLALVQRQASRLNQAASEDPRELSAKESEEAALSAMMELAPDNTIRVKSRQNMCLNAAGGTNSASDPIILWSCTGAANEQFEYRATDSTIRVKSKPNMCFNVENGALVQGANLILWSCTGAANEKFVVRTDNTIRVVGTGLCLNAAGATFNNGDQIVLWPCSGALNEEFVPNTGAPTESPTSSPTDARATLKLNRKLADNADVRQMYDDLADAGDDCIHFPVSGDGCGQTQCTKGTNHHATCTWSHQAASVSGTAAPYTISAAGLVQGSSSGCITANSCVMGMFETTKYSALCKGDSIEAVYSAAQGSDWFEVAMGLYEGTPGYNPTFVEKMIYRGSAVSNAIAKFTIPRNGDFFVRIFGASYDRTGGTWLGASLTLESEFEVVGSCSVNGVTQQNANPPTPWPTPPPTNAGQPTTPSAVGDPHLINSRGEHFNIFKTGQMEFLRVPYESVAAKADFTALATIQAVGETDNKCEEAQFITGMRFGGSWLKGKTLEVNLDEISEGSVQKKVTVLLGGDQVMPSPEPIDVGENMKLIWHHDEQLVLKVGEASVDMKLSHYFLNVEARSFKSLGSKIGGLLGEDDHAGVSTPPPECERETLAKASQPIYSSARMSMM